MSDKSSGGSRMAEHAQNVKDEGASAMHDAAGAASAMASKYAKQGAGLRQARLRHGRRKNG